VGEHAAELPPSWTGVDLDVLDVNPDPGGAMHAAVEARPDVLFGPCGRAARRSRRLAPRTGLCGTTVGRPPRSGAPIFRT
jgi:hypothetical protein